VAWVAGVYTHTITQKCGCIGCEYKSYVETKSADRDYLAEDHFYPCVWWEPLGFDEVAYEWDAVVEKALSEGAKMFDRIFATSPEGVYLKFLEGTLDLSKCTGQELRDIWSQVNDKPTGRKTSGSLTSKKAIIAACITGARVQAKYPDY